MKEFNWAEFKNKENKIAVYCKTEEEAKDFCKQMHKHGMKWCTGDSYIDYIRWDMFKEATCYSNVGFHDNYYFYECINYTILEWSDYMVKPFTKADLRVGDIVKTRKGDILVILPNKNSNDGLGTYSKIANGCQEYLHSYRQDLTHKKEEYDIVAVLRTSQAGNENNAYRLLGLVLTYYDKEMVADQFQYLKWDWERTEPKEEPIKELTMEELEKHFGCKVKIVAEN